MFLMGFSSPIPWWAFLIVLDVKALGVLSGVLIVAVVSIVTPNSFKRRFTSALFLSGILITRVSIHKYKYYLINIIAAISKYYFTITLNLLSVFNGNYNVTPDQVWFRGRDLT
jgi:hypothetical protein